MAKKQKKLESNEPTQIVRANVNREVATDAAYVSLYANDTQLQISPWDFRFIFGVIVSMPSDDEPAVRVKQIGDVRMSPQHAKKIAEVLVLQIKVYEQNFGKIPQPEDIKPK